MTSRSKFGVRFREVANDACNLKVGRLDSDFPHLTPELNSIGFENEVPEDTLLDLEGYEVITKLARTKQQVTLVERRIRRTCGR
mmetsp:Transcript_26262/g.36590  ORF Transcript_26262/g.36590 Transcript_26262/m.36590 type:complete len:84 (+) Transcript_26262:655-906(+)